MNKRESSRTNRAIFSTHMHDRGCILHPKPVDEYGKFKRFGLSYGSMIREMISGVGESDVVETYNSSFSQPLSDMNVTLKVN